MPFTHGDIAKVDLRWQVGAIGFAANVFQVKCDQATPHNLADLDVCTDMGAWITDILDPMQVHIVVSCVVHYCAAYKKVGLLWNLIGPVPVIFIPTSGSDPLPSGVAGLMVGYTDLSKVVGKKYFVGLSETSQTAGLWVAGVLAAMLQSALAWIVPFTSVTDPTTTWIPGVWSAKAVGFKAFSASVGVRDVPAYQRRRKQGVGT